MKSKSIRGDRISHSVSSFRKPFDYEFFIVPSPFPRLRVRVYEPPDIVVDIFLLSILAMKGKRIRRQRFENVFDVGLRSAGDAD